MNLDDVIPVLDVVREASSVVLEIYDKPFGVDYKAPEDPVTAADRAANELICVRLREQYPDIPIVAEESAPETFAGFRSAPRVFFVDPVDGTREFIDKNGEFVVMVGLLVEDRVEVGVIYAPALDTGWCGVVGQGAFEFDRTDRREAIRVSDVSELSQARVVASRSHRSPELEHVLGALGVRATLPVGSAGLKGAAVAHGAAEAYIAPGYAGKRWDAAAVDALVRAAGGEFTDAYGRPIDYRDASLKNDRGLCAANAALHASIIERMAELRRRT